MKRIVEKKTQARKKSRSKMRRATQREIEPATHVIERKPRGASGMAPKLKRRGGEETSRGQAQKVGRAVGKILGRVIGTVEQAVAKVMPKSKPKAVRQAPSSGRRKQRS